MVLGFKGSDRLLDAVVVRLPGRSKYRTGLVVAWVGPVPPRHRLVKNAILLSASEQERAALRAGGYQFAAAAVG